ncbi:MAG: glutaredoxin family protein [Acidobacteria bacterium]|nr:glutaredoxin family protein [Acidobacteriota bacterium]
MAARDGSAAAGPVVVLYSRKGCHLCESAKQALAAVAGTFPLRVEEVDIDLHPFLKREFSAEVPVIWMRGDKVGKLRVDAAVLERRLGLRREEKRP